MNELLKEKLQRLSEDELLLEAIRAVFSQAIELEKPRVESGEANELIGEKYRAYDKAKEILNKTFIDLDSFRVNKNNQSNFNKAR